MSKGYDKLIADTEKAISIAETLLSAYIAAEKNFALERLKLDHEDQINLQKIMVTLNKVIRHNKEYCE